MGLTPHKISFICFLDLFAASLIVPLMNNYLRGEIRLSNFSIGLISSTFSLLQIVSAPTVGYLSDLCGRKSILLCCLLVCVFSYLLLGLFRNVFVIVFVRVLLGLFKHTQVICKAYVSDVCVDSSKAYSQLMTVTFLGFFIGPALGGHIITYENGFMIICCIAAAVFLVNFVYSYWVVTDERRSSSTGGLSEGGKTSGDGKPGKYLPGEDASPLLDEETDGTLGTSCNSSDSDADTEIFRGNSRKRDSRKSQKESPTDLGTYEDDSHKIRHKKSKTRESKKLLSTSQKSHKTDAETPEEMTSTAFTVHETLGDDSQKTNSRKSIKVPTDRDKPHKTVFEKTTPIAEKTTPIAEKTTPIAEKTTLIAERTTRIAEKSTPIGASPDISKSTFLSYCKETFNIEWSRYGGIFLIKFLYALSMSLFYSNYISVLTHNFGSSSQLTGYTVSFQGLVGSFANIFISLKHRDNYTSLFLSFFLLSASVLGLYLCTHLYVFVVLLIPLSVSSSLIRVLCINITMTASDANRNGNISGIYNSLTSIAKVVTPLLGGLVSDWVQDNYKVTFLVAFVFALLGVIVSGVVTLRAPPRSVKETKTE